MFLMFLLVFINVSNVYASAMDDRTALLRQATASTEDCLRGLLGGSAMHNKFELHLDDLDPFSHKTFRALLQEAEDKGARLVVAAVRCYQLYRPRKLQIGVFEGAAWKQFEATRVGNVHPTEREINTIDEAFYFALEQDLKVN